MKKAIKHQIDSLKAIEIIKEAGIAGYGVYWFIEEYLHTIRGNAIPYEDEGLAPLAMQINTPLKDIQKVVRLCLKLKLFYLEGITLRTQKLRKEVNPELSKKRKAASLAGLRARLMNKGIKAPVVAEVPKPEAIPVVKAAKVLKPKVTKPKPVEKKVEAVLELPLPELKTQPETPKQEPFKEWLFLGLFNEIRLEKKPNARGNTILSGTDKTNFKKLIEGGYVKEDFEVVIRQAFSSEYVMENGLDTPEHVLRVGNFQRYLNQSQVDKKKDQKFLSNRG